MRREQSDAYTIHIIGQILAAKMGKYKSEIAESAKDEREGRKKRPQRAHRKAGEA